ncbi:hypothetical protein niasHT_021101 [Heterodera trifolii]|uniref:3-beta hydroxysteroid dehydrogenase/isomerase domain-containing protein n=1 Tax=Heterodera trifolii TaxID=157864 RepID=A0ABD2JF05_9BILA
MGVKVAITGGSGFLAAHLIKRLRADSNVDEIRTIDRKPFRQLGTIVCSSSDDCPPSSVAFPPLIHFQCDLLDVAKLEKALDGVDVLFHLARKAFEYIFFADQKALNDRYSRDNLEATHSLLNAIFKCSVPRLVHVGETRTKAELAGREKCGKILTNGQPFHALFLRPTFVYGEGEKRLPMALRKVAERHGEINEIAGPSNGMLQYIYAGNLAPIMVESMQLLLSDKAENLSGTYFYCMDDTVCTKFGEFCAPFVRALGHRMGPPIANQWATLFKLFVEQQIRSLCGWEVTPGGDFSATALRFLFNYAIGFSDRTMALNLKHRSKRGGRSEWTKRTADWIRREMGEAEEAKEVREEQRQQKKMETEGEEIVRRLG